MSDQFMEEERGSEERPSRMVRIVAVGEIELEERS